MNKNRRSGLFDVYTDISFMNCGGKNGNGYWIIWIGIGKTYVSVREQFEKEIDAKRYANESIYKYELYDIWESDIYV